MKSYAGDPVVLEPVLHDVAPRIGVTPASRNAVSTQPRALLVIIETNVVRVRTIMDACSWASR